MLDDICEFLKLSCRVAADDRCNCKHWQIALMPGLGMQHCMMKGTHLDQYRFDVMHIRELTEACLSLMVGTTDQNKIALSVNCLCSKHTMSSIHHCLCMMELLYWKEQLPGGEGCCRAFSWGGAQRCQGLPSQYPPPAVCLGVHSAAHLKASSSCHAAGQAQRCKQASSHMAQCLRAYRWNASLELSEAKDGTS